MAEEIVDAPNASPKGILVGVFFMAGVGWIWVLRGD